MNKTIKHNLKQEQKQKRLTRYSLRSLLLIMFVIAISFGLFNRYKTERATERTAIEKLDPERIYYDFNFANSDEIIEGAKPKGPQWVRNWMKDDLFFARARHLEISHDENPKLSVDVKELDGIGSLKQLQFLKVASTGLGNVDGISGLKQLRTLQLAGVKASCDLSPIGNLRNLTSLSLHATGGDGITYSMKQLQNHPSIESATFSTWKLPFKLDNIESLTTLPKLKKLIFDSCEFSVELPTTKTDNDTSQFSYLRELVINDNDSMKSLGVLSVAPKLRILWLEHCDQLDLSDSVVKLPSLESLSISRSKSLVAVDAFANSSAINNVYIRECPKLESIDGFIAATKLNELLLYDCPLIKNFDGLRNNQKLSEVWIGECQGLENIRGLRSATNLKSLTLYGIPRLESLDGLEAGQLTSFHFGGSKQIKSMSPLKKAKNLKSLNIEKCPKLKKLELHPAAKLEGMQLRCDFSLASLKRSFRDADALIHCSLSESSEVKSLNLFRDCAALQSLTVYNLANLNHISDTNMKPLSNLRSLKIFHCPKLTSLKGMKNFKQIRELEILGCKTLSDASQLSQLDGIRTLTIANCPKLIDYSFVRQLKDKSKISVVRFNTTSIPFETFAKLAKETSIRIMYDGRDSRRSWSE